ncbi:MAG: hypothetical protein IAF58_00575, partial [Leptolyngbya sp.]|nr:hypothetical protein [Candidatus Melainabacteria bacterium]
MVALVPEEKLIQFPADRSLGELYTLSESGATSFVGEAIGTVKVPFNADLALYFSFDQISGCQPLTRVAPNLLTAVSFLGTDISDIDLEHVGKLTKLRELDISCTEVGDSGLPHLELLSDLRRLNLSSTKITNA